MDISHALELSICYSRSSVTSCWTEDGAEKALFIVTNVLAVSSLMECVWCLCV